MPFTFRLDPLISIRDNVLKEKQAALAQAYEARRIKEDERVEVEQNIVGNLQSAREAMQSGKIDVNFLLGVRRHEMFLLVQLEEVRQQIVMIEEEIERRHQAVIEANKELKIIEKLKDKKREQYIAEENRKEIREMDEIAGVKRMES